MNHRLRKAKYLHVIACKGSRVILLSHDLRFLTVRSSVTYSEQDIHIVQNAKEIYPLSLISLPGFVL